MRNAKPILLVEDDEVDAITTRKALGEINVANELIHKYDGKEALEYLRNEGNARPCIILLDLDMPQMDGFEFLAAVKSEDSLKKIPLIVLAASDADENVTKAFESAAAGYILKTIDYGRFVEMMRTVNDYWTLSRLPNGD